ncbi:MAG: hypothetical protein HW389_1213, partial [Bacteroidetes bacterium]|nr:hypothetical protein [Bacteroidota bacterium]
MARAKIAKITAMPKLNQGEALRATTS